MYSDLAAYGLLASIFIVTGLRMFIDKPNRTAPNSIRWLERFRKNHDAKAASIDS
jgi:hypothetical protein